MAYTRACKSYEPYRPSACTHTHSSSSTFAICFIHFFPERRAPEENERIKSSQITQSHLSLRRTVLRCTELSGWMKTNKEDSLILEAMCMHLFVCHYELGDVNTRLCYT